MSDTVNPAPASAVVNAAVKTAQDMPQLVGNLEVVAPDIAARLTTAVASVHAAPWGGAAIALVAWGVTKLGLGWSTDFDTIVVGAAYMLGSYAIPAILAKIAAKKGVPNA